MILIRENPETLTCSSCAGTLEGIDAFGSREIPDYQPVRSIMNRFGEVYRALRIHFGTRLNIEVVDPRNEFYLIPVLIRDYRKYRPPVKSFLRTLLFGISPASVIVNGRILHVGELPTPEVLIREIEEILGESVHPAS